MESHTNSSNNTLFADAEGNIAYLHSNFVPVRDTASTTRSPVDGSDPATDWQGCTPSRSRPTPSTRRPAGPSARTTGRGRRPAPAARARRTFPATWTGAARTRGASRLLLLEGRSLLTLEGLRDAAYSSATCPPSSSWCRRWCAGGTRCPAGHAAEGATAEQVALLRAGIGAGRELGGHLAGRVLGHGAAASGRADARARAWTSTSTRPRAPGGDGAAGGARRPRRTAGRRTSATGARRGARSTGSSG
jgi:hypothetical protein